MSNSQTRLKDKCKGVKVKIGLGKYQVSPKGIKSYLDCETPSGLEEFINGVQIVCKLLNQTKDISIQSETSDKCSTPTDEIEDKLFHIKVGDNSGIVVNSLESSFRIGNIDPVIKTEGFTIALSPKTIVECERRDCCSVSAIQPENQEKVFQATIYGMPEMFLRGMIEALDRKIFIRTVTSNFHYTLELSESIDGFYNGNKLARKMKLPVRTSNSRLLYINFSDEGNAKVVPLQDEFRLIRNCKTELSIPRDKVDDNLVAPLLNNEKEYKGSLDIVETPDGLYLVAGTNLQPFSYKVYVQPLSINQAL